MTAYHEEHPADDDFPRSEVPEGHQTDEDGEHYPDACYQCVLARDPALSSCRCGNCCRSMLIEVLVEDAEREPRIKELASPIYADARLTLSGQRELEGYLLNTGENGACVFLDDKTNLCTIYETRPLLCRVFDCDGEAREQLLDLGILERTSDAPIDA